MCRTAQLLFCSWHLLLILYILFRPGVWYQTFRGVLSGIDIRFWICTKTASQKSFEKFIHCINRTAFLLVLVFWTSGEKECVFCCFYNKALRTRNKPFIFSLADDFFGNRISWRIAYDYKVFRRFIYWNIYTCDFLNICTKLFRCKNFSRCGIRGQNNFAYAFGISVIFIPLSATIKSILG